MYQEEIKDKYEPLEMEVIRFEEEDVIVTSGDGDTPWGPNLGL